MPSEKANIVVPGPSSNSSNNSITPNTDFLGSLNAQVLCSQTKESLRWEPNTQDGTRAGARALHANSITQPVSNPRQ